MVFFRCRNKPALIRGRLRRVGLFASFVFTRWGTEMRNLIAACLAGGLAVFGAANAAVLNFVAEAAGNERGVDDGTVIVFDGLAVTFSASGPGGGFAYFDDLFDGLPAGLGVCETLAGPAPAPCGPGADDNINAGESVTLTFSEEVSLSAFSFSGEEHVSLNASLSTLLINGISFTFADVFNFTPAVAAAVANLLSVTFAYGGSAPAEFYINSFSATPVPLPAAAPLLLAGIAGLGLAGRKKKRA